MRPFAAAWTAIWAVWLAGCGGPAAPVPPETWFDVGVGGQTVRLQLAVEGPEHQRGLMFREQLGPDEGMLFLFPAPQRMSFWMKNTVLPLDIGYFDGAGVLREIYPLYPRDERAVASRRSDLRFALEMNQGWYARRGLKPGAQLDLAAVRRAMQARGVQPDRFLPPAP